MWFLKANLGLASSAPHAADKTDKVLLGDLGLASRDVARLTWIIITKLLNH